jgi:t-SNARE complex subunit (syntaxin)
LTITKIYYSREDRINDIQDAMERVQYDKPEEDTRRVTSAQELFDEYAEKLYDSLEEYIKELSNTEVDEDSQSQMRYARQQVVERWAMMQAALSKVAWVLRIDGNQAYERLINSIRTDDPLDMRGL